jgi:L-lactate dehydrogenase
MSVTTNILIPKQGTKIVIIGAGHVGATTAFSLMLNNLGEEIVLIDIDKKTTQGHAIDLINASVTLPSIPSITAGCYDDCVDADIVILTAGHAQKLGETDKTLLDANFKILQDVAPRVGRLAPHAIMIVAAHPVEILTYAAAKLSGLPSQNVIGFGTSLDTTRFQYELAKHYSVDPRNVYAPVVGQHGMMELALWSSITIDGLPLRSYCEQIGRGYEDNELFTCFWRAKEAVFDIIDAKGSPSFSMASGLSAIVEAILRDQNTLMTVAVIGKFLSIDEVALSLPARLSRTGASPMPGWSDNWSEEEALRSAAMEISDAIKALKIEVKDEKPRLEKRDSAVAS